MRLVPSLVALGLLIASTSRAGVTIVCLGDSVTKANQQGIAPDQTFCARLEKMPGDEGHEANAEGQQRIADWLDVELDALLRDAR